MVVYCHLNVRLYHAVLRSILIWIVIIANPCPSLAIEDVTSTEVPYKHVSSVSPSGPIVKRSQYADSPIYSLITKNADVVSVSPFTPNPITTSTSTSVDLNQTDYFYFVSPITVSELERLQWSTTEPPNSWLEMNPANGLQVWVTFLDRVSHLHVVDMLIILVGGSLSLVTIFGNVLVMVAFKIDRNLQTISNYFLLSLAVADFLIGFISMPLSLIYIVARGWPLSPMACDFWLAIDYLNSNASVLNLLLISFDRYFSVTRPLTYRAKRTTKRAGLLIASAWIISALLWPPWIFAWPSIEGRRTVPHDQCYIPFLESNIWVTVITAIIAFWLPVTIMCVLYWKIWLETEKRYRELTSLVVTPKLNQREQQQQQQQQDQTQNKKKTAKKTRRTHIPSCSKSATQRNKIRISIGTSSGANALPLEFPNVARGTSLVNASVSPCVAHQHDECVLCHNNVDMGQVYPVTQYEPQIFSTHDYTDVIRLDEIRPSTSGIVVGPLDDIVNETLGSGDGGTGSQAKLPSKMSRWFKYLRRKSKSEPIVDGGECPACLHQKRQRKRRRLIAKRQAQLERMESEQTNGDEQTDVKCASGTETVVTVHDTNQEAANDSMDIYSNENSSESSIYTIVIKLQPKEDSGEPTATVHMVCSESNSRTNIYQQGAGGGGSVGGSGAVGVGVGNGGGIGELINNKQMDQTIQRAGMKYAYKHKLVTQRVSSTPAETGTDSSSANDDDDDDVDDEAAAVVGIGSDDNNGDDDFLDNNSVGEQCHEDEDEDVDEEGDDEEEEDASDDESIRVRMCCTRKKSTNVGTSVVVPDPDPISARVRTTIQPKSERKAAKTLSAILLAFIVTWTPYNVLGR